MITIVTGEKDSGKSSYLQNWYTTDPVGCGILSQKVIRNNLVAGYDMLLLPSLVKMPLCRTPNHLEDLQTTDTITQGRFTFSASTFQEAISQTMPLLLCSDTFWLDEIGQLELNNAGYAPLLHFAIMQCCNLRLGVRLSLLPDIIERFDLHACQIIKLS